MGKAERFCSEMTIREAKKDVARLFQQRPAGEKMNGIKPDLSFMPLDGNDNIEYSPPLVRPGCTPSYLARKAKIRERAMHMAKTENTGFDPVAFLAGAGLGRRIVKLRAKQAFFTQGSPADAIFYLQSGRAKLTVMARNGKEATISLLIAGEFIGEESIAGAVGLRLATATAISGCTALKIDREEMLRVLHEEHAFSDLFLKFLLARSMRTQADLVDQLFNSSEKRLARILLLMAEFGKPGEPETTIPQITQETLAEMIGTTRSRVSFFMNRFRKMGFIEYNGQILVHKSLLNVILYD
jgi:CRP/FNR family cyclic AMP-dependent transcriptional regulator